MAMTDELTAINMMLAAIGEDPVQSLSSTVPEAVAARTTLANINREVQGDGLHCNTDYDVEMVPDPVTKEITVPSNIISIDAVYASDDVVVRGAKLYDRSNRTFQFDRPVMCRIVTLLNFDDLPEPHRYYIAVRAARIFQQQKVGSDLIERFTADDEYRAKAMMLSQEMKSSDYRMADFNPVAGILGRW